MAFFLFAYRVRAFFRTFLYEHPMQCLLKKNIQLYLGDPNMLRKLTLLFCVTLKINKFRVFLCVMCIVLCIYLFFLRIFVCVCVFTYFCIPGSLILWIHMGFVEDWKLFWHSNNKAFLGKENWNDFIWFHNIIIIPVYIEHKY